MNFQNSCSIRVPIQKLWEFLTVIPSVATCMPGVEEVKEVGEGKYEGTQVVKVGMVKLKMAGKISIQHMDNQTRTAIMLVEAADKRISGVVQGKLTMNLEEVSPEETKLNVTTDINLFGKLGEFGGPMIKKKSDQMMAEFAANVAQRVGSPDAAKKAAPSGSIFGLSGS